VYGCIVYILYYILDRHLFPLFKPNLAAADRAVQTVVTSRQVTDCLHRYQQGTEKIVTLCDKRLFVGDYVEK